MPQQALFFRPSVAALFCAACLFSATAWSQGSSSQVQRDRAACDGVQQDREACRREAGAAKQEAQRGGLAPAGQAEQNALARCQLLQPAADRADCEARVRGAASSSSGSVMGGGVIRESVTPVPAPAPSPSPSR
jgi:outer membrane murein-binding lipoprotein Lpp